MYVTSMKYGENDPPTAGSLLKITGLGAKCLPAVNYQARWIFRVGFSFAFTSGWINPDEGYIVRNSMTTYLELIPA